MGEVRQAVLRPQRLGCREGRVDITVVPELPTSRERGRLQATEDLCVVERATLPLIPLDLEGIPSSLGGYVPVGDYSDATLDFDDLVHARHSQRR